MKLDRIPARMLLVLGLGPGCGPTIDEVDTTAADSGDGESTRGSTSGMTATSSSSTPGTSTGDISTSACLDVGTCLSEDVGPCLAPEPPETTSSGDDTGMSSDTLGPCLDIDPTSGSGSSGGSSDTGTIEPCLSPPPGDAPAPDGPAALAPPGARSTHVLDRVLSSGRLPEDVAERLKRRR